MTHTTIKYCSIWAVVFFVIYLSHTYISSPADQQATAHQKQQDLALNACMSKHRWDTTAINTSRLAVSFNFERMGKGELAKHVSDYDAVKMVYCTPKQQAAK